MNEIDIKHFLDSYSCKEIIYIMNPGNGGDALIAKGTFQVFNDLGLSYKMGSHRDKFSNKILFYAGGGNLVGKSMNGKKSGMSCHNFINNNIRRNEIVILPHTITNEDSLLSSLPENIKFICREKISYKYVSDKFNFKSNVFLSQDMAFYLNDLSLYSDKTPRFDVLHAFRTDRESSGRNILPDDNIDLSNECNNPDWWKKSDLKVLDITYDKIFQFVSDYALVKTDRLHVAIACALINKPVHLYANYYYKSKAIYEYSLHKYSSVKFFD